MGDILSGLSGGNNNLPPFGQLNAPVGAALGSAQGGTIASYNDLGLTGAGFGGQPGVPTTAELRDLQGESQEASALTFQNLQRYAAAQNSANQPKGAGTSTGTGTGGFSSGFGNQGGGDPSTSSSFV